MNNFTNNFIDNPWWYSSSYTDVNHAGIYFCTHFFNPGTPEHCTDRIRYSVIQYCICTVLMVKS